MKFLTKFILAMLLVTALLWPVTALAQGRDGDEVVFGGTFSLETGEVLDGNLYVIGGIARLEDGSRVAGDIYLAGGTLRADGEIDGSITATGGLVDLGDTAVVSGDVNVFAANLSQADGARVEGEVNNDLTGPMQIRVPNGVPDFRARFNPIWDTLWSLFRSFVWAILAVLVVLFLPVQVERTSRAAVAQPLLAGGLGLLTAIVVPLLLVVVAITLIGIPISLLGGLLLAVAWGFGVISLGTEVGKRLAGIFKQEWALAVAAGVGTFLLVLVSNGFDKLVPCVGWVVTAVIGVIGLGAVLMTRFGTQPYPPYGPIPTTPVPPPAPPTAPRQEVVVTEPVEPSTDVATGVVEEEPLYPPLPDVETLPPEDEDERPRGGAQVFPAGPE